MKDDDNDDDDDDNDSLNFIKNVMYICYCSQTPEFLNISNDFKESSGSEISLLKRSMFLDVR